MTPDLINDLMNAIRINDVKEVVSIIHNQKNIVNQKNSKGYSPLLLAAYYDNLDILKKLLDAGANVNDRESAGNTSLIAATLKGYKSVVQELLNFNADPNIQNYSGETALFYACSFNHEDIAKLLLKHGAAIDLKDSRGVSALEQGKKLGIPWIKKLSVAS